MNNSQKIPNDDHFTIHISDNMELRNLLRAGLVMAQDKDTEKTPIFVSWPQWLNDGIMCLYVRDFNHILKSVMSDTADSIITMIEKSRTAEQSSEPEKNI